MKRLLLILVLISYLFAGCADHHKSQKMEIKTYKVTQVESDGSIEIIYWYLLFFNNTYYSTSSPVPITSFNGINWAESPTAPSELMGADDLGTTTISSDNLSSDMQSTVDAASESGTDAGNDSGTDASSESGSDASGDSGSDAGGDSGSDAGSSSDGGGDSGGGDGGGGGE